MDKRIFKFLLSFIIVFTIILSTQYTEKVFAEKIDPKDYIKDIKIIDNDGNAEDWFDGFRIEDNKLILVVEENKIDLFWNWEDSGNLEWKDLIIETENIQKIIVNNPISLPANEDWEFISAKGIKNFEAKPEEWNKGVNFLKLGAYVEGEYWNEYQALFSKDAPLEFTFISVDGERFTLEWEAIGYKVKKPDKEEIIEISITPQNNYDETAKAGIVKEKDGEETLVYSEYYKIGDTVTIKSIGGEKSKFKEWYSTNYYQDPPKGHDPSKYIILEKFIGDINKNELTFTVDEKFKNIKKNSRGKNKLSIDASFNTFNKVYMNTAPENEKLKATVDRDVVPGGDQFTIEAKSEDENWMFDEWELYPIITGFHTLNPDANLTEPKLTLTMEDTNIQISEERFKLYATAHFKERDKEPEEKQKYTIDFNTNGGNDMPSAEVKEGQVFTKSADPIREGYKFVGWYSDEKLTNKFDFSTEIKADITLYAKWEEDKNTPPVGEFEILDVKLHDTFEGKEWLLEYKIEDETIALFLLGGDHLQWIEENDAYLEDVKLKIKTHGVKDITLENKNDKYKVDKRITKSYNDWEEGISFLEFGTKNGEVDIENPPTLIFHTTSGEDIPYKLNFKEGELPFKVEISITPQNVYDKTAKAGIIKYDENEEEFVSFGHYEIGDTVTIKAIDGEKSKFKGWWSGEYYQSPPEGHDPSKHIILEDFIGDITDNELKFTIDEKFKNLKTVGGTKDKLSISANFDTSSKIFMNTEPENDKLIATIYRDVVPKGEEFTIEAKSEDENWVFDRWEMDPPITGDNTANPDVNLKMKKLTLNMPDLANPQEIEKSHRLNITAHFKERDKEPGIQNIELIQLETNENLPNKIRIITTNNETVEVDVKRWETGNIDLSQSGEYTIKAVIDWNLEEKEIDVQIVVKGDTEEKQKYTINYNANGGNEIPSIEVEEGQVLTKPVDPTKEGYRFVGWYMDEDLIEGFDFNTPITENIVLYAKWEKDESTDETLEITSVELVKGGKIISKGVIKNRKITLELPKGYDESIIGGNHFLKITGTEGANLSQDRGYDGPIEEWDNGNISNSIMAGQSKKFTLYRGDNFVEYTIEIIEQREPTLPEKNEYTITFNTNGGSGISSQKVKEDKKVFRPSDPTKLGYKFVGWYEDSNLTRVFDFNTSIVENIILYAKWEKTDKPTPKPEEKGEPKITGFSLLGVKGYINHNKETIEVYLPFTMDLDYLVPDISYEGEDIYPSIGKPQNFNRTMYYTVSGNGYSSKTYKVYVDMPQDRYDRYDRYGRYDRNTYYDFENWYRPSPESSKKNKDNKDWYEITQEIKKKRLEEEETPSLTSKEVKKAALNEAGRITAQSESEKRDLSISQGNDHMEIKLNSLGKSDYMKNQINIPAGVLTNLNELGFDYLKYSTTLVRIKIFPFMDSADGLYLNIKPAPSNIQSIWKKTKGAGRMFHIETNSTKAGLSFEMKLDKNLPREQIRVVKYNYMKSKFEDINPDKWSIINRHVHVEQVSDGIYGIMYEK